MTTRLYYDDAYLTEFRAQVVEVAGDRVYLDRTAFYPDSGGQPHDQGSISGADLTSVIDEGERIAHFVRGALAVGEAECRLDWGRRFDHMQQHSGQHLLSAVLADLFRLETLSFHLGSEVSTIDVAAPSVEPAWLAQAESRANAIVFENRPIIASYHDDPGELGLRKASERQGRLRVITIQDLDRSACGGTHVRATGEIGPVFLRGTDKIRGNTRIEFVCGSRAVRRARADYDALSSIARSLGAPLAEAPALVTAQSTRLAGAEKTRLKLALELAQVHGRDLARSSPAFHLARLAQGGLDDVIRAESQSYTAHGGSAYLAVAEETKAILLAVSPNCPHKAAALLKPILDKHGGRGGGSPQLAQGSLGDQTALEAAVAELKAFFS